MRREAPHDAPDDDPSVLHTSLEYVRAMQRGPGAREVLIQAGFTFAVNGAFPRVEY